MRPASIGGTPGPFFNLTGGNLADPADDTADWVYCCGTPVLGYPGFSQSGSFNNSYGANSSSSLMQYTFAPSEAPMFHQLAVNLSSVAGSPAQYGYCNKSGWPNCCTGGDNHCAAWQCINNVTIPCQFQTVAACGPTNMTWTVQKNGAATPLTVSSSVTSTTYSPSGNTATFAPGDTLLIQTANPSSCGDTFAGSWAIQ